jgi:Uma2 family endonuclease
MAEPARQFPYISPADYLVLERNEPAKHEYFDGLVYMMAGASRRHNAIAQRGLRVLGDHVKSPCEPYALDIKVEVKARNETHFFYPDLLVTCSELDDDPDIVRHPILVVEILSDSTREYDRHGKFEKYRLLPSLQEYVLVEQDIQTVEVFRKRANWTSEVFQPPQALALESIQLTIPVSALY